VKILMVFHPKSTEINGCDDYADIFFREIAPNAREAILEAHSKICSYFTCDIIDSVSVLVDPNPNYKKTHCSIRIVVTFKTDFLFGVKNILEDRADSLVSAENSVNNFKKRITDFIVARDSIVREKWKLRLSEIGENVTRKA
jgi:hypothetical protein